MMPIYGEFIGEFLSQPACLPCVHHFCGSFEVSPPAFLQKYILIGHDGFLASWLRLGLGLRGKCQRLTFGHVTHFNCELTAIPRTANNPHKVAEGRLRFPPTEREGYVHRSLAYMEFRSRVTVSVSSDRHNIQIKLYVIHKLNNLSYLQCRAFVSAVTSCFYLFIYFLCSSFCGNLYISAVPLIYACAAFVFYKFYRCKLPSK